jgi:uncharacterized protein YjbI with pentapeptide repeats
LSVDRRHALKLAAIMAGGAIAAPVVARAHVRQVSQIELDAAIARHAVWLADRHRGARAVFANCDLSGLDFSRAGETPVDLRGSDFTEADLSGSTGKLISFRRASLHHARLSWSRLVEPTFIDASLRGAACDGAVWGWDDSQGGGAAMMYNCDAAKTDFRGARVRGHFLETNFNSASLIDADLSGSVFHGSTFYQTSFFAADLTRARFVGVEIAYARFSRTNLTETDFSGARIGPGVLPPLRIKSGEDTPC